MPELPELRSARRLIATSLAGLTVAVLLAAPAQAQQVYRIVGPDGKVTFSDKPPVEPNARTKAAPVATTGPSAANTGSALPFELRQVASRYPVTLYTGANCIPCGSGRAFLAGRGIPFTEKTVSTNADIEALQRLSSGSSLPFMTIGGQQLKGFAEAEWTAFLDAAGYPKTSQLPSGYRQAAASPLVAVQPPPASPGAPAGDAPAATAQTPAAPPPPAPAENPAGIRF